MSSGGCACTCTAGRPVLGARAAAAVRVDAANQFLPEENLTGKTGTYPRLGDAAGARTRGRLGSLVADANIRCDSLSLAAQYGELVSVRDAREPNTGSASAMSRRLECFRVRRCGGTGRALSTRAAAAARRQGQRTRSRRQQRTELRGLPADRFTVDGHRWRPGPTIASHEAGVASHNVQDCLVLPTRRSSSPGATNGLTHRSSSTGTTVPVGRWPGEGGACLCTRGAGEAHGGTTACGYSPSVTQKRVCGTPS